MRKFLIVAAISVSALGLAPSTAHAKTPAQTTNCVAGQAKAAWESSKGNAAGAAVKFLLTVGRCFKQPGNTAEV
ncbi:MAG: hypothetical protein JWM47_1364 [Acidimicrobiales bacterium]|nr:hypothetical protein [Acidimicrobiales bacterium]